MTKLFTRAAITLAVVAVVVLTPLSVHATSDPVTPGSDTLSTEAPPPSEPPLDPPHTPVTYAVGEYVTTVVDTLDNGLTRMRDVLVTEDVNYIANKVNLTTDEIEYSNPDKDVTKLNAGDTLTLPPVHGVVYKIQQGDTLSWIAYSYQVDINNVVSYNNIADPNQISPDQVIIIPGAKLPPLPPPTPVYTPVSNSGSYTAPTSPMTSASGNHFFAGYCTAWAAKRWHDTTGVWIPWFGDAGTWLSGARSVGWPTGSIPRVGSMVVEGPNHVAFVESVGTSSFVVSEANWNAWNVVDYRTISNSDPSILGFIY